MRSPLLRIPFVALAALVLAALPAVAGAAPGGDSTSGHTVVFGASLDWSARSTSTGLDARGKARLSFTSSDPNQTYAGEVTCLRVVGATATTPTLASIGVRITEQPAGLPYQSLVIYASDSGKFGSAPDTATWVLSTAPPPPDGGCPAPTTGSPIADGEVVINNALP